MPHYVEERDPVMKRRLAHLVALLALVSLVFATTACKKKPPAPATDMDTSSSTVSEPDRDVAPPPTPSPVGDDATRGIPSDIEGAERYAYSNGLLGEIYFAFNSSALTASARERLAKNAHFLNGDGGGFVVTIDGHCDERGTNQYNVALGERRANATRDYLMSLGVDGARLRTISYGEERPVCNQSDESCWSRNRRAYFRLTGKR